MEPFLEQTKQSVLSTVLNKWFDERVIYKNRMKECYKNDDSEGGLKIKIIYCSIQ